MGSATRVGTVGSHGDWDRLPVRGLSNSKATRLAVVVGGMVELLVWWGIATMITSQVAAIVWLFRSFSSAHIPRSLIAAVSIFASGLMLFLVFTFLFWGRRFLEQATSP